MTDDSFSPNDARRRHRFRAVNRAVKEKGLIEFGHQLLEIYHKTDKTAPVSIGRSMCGSYHILYPLLVNEKPQWLIKIPHNGIKARWDEDSAKALVSEAKTMSFLKRMRAREGPSKLPIPRVLAYSDTIENSIGCPYIALDYINGVPLFNIWYQHRLKSDNVNAEMVKQKRKRALLGLGEAMAELGMYKFDLGGSLLFENSKSVDGHTFLNSQSEAKFPRVGPARLPDEEAMLAIALEHKNTDKSTQLPAEQVKDSNGQYPAPSQPETVAATPSRVHRSGRVLSAAVTLIKCVICKNCTHSNQGTRVARSPALPTSNASVAEPIHVGINNENGDGNDTIPNLLYFTWGPSSTPSKYVTAPLDKHPAKHHFQQGVHALLRKLIEWIPDPFVVSATGRFVLRHPDLDMQNILVDDDGTVVGILDWDGTAAVPRCLGNECYPSFLISDWNPETYDYNPAMDSKDYDPDRNAYKPWEDSPDTLRELRNMYLSIVMELQGSERDAKGEPLFSQHLEKVCRQSVVAENVAIAAADPLCRSQILRKVVTESWVALEKNGGPDYRHLSSYNIIEMFVSGDLDENVIKALETGFLCLLETVDK